MEGAFDAPSRRSAIKVLSRRTGTCRSARSVTHRRRFAASLSLFRDRGLAGHHRSPAGHSGRGRGRRATGAVLCVTGRGPVTFSAYLRRLPASFGVDRRDGRFRASVESEP